MTIRMTMRAHGATLLLLMLAPGAARADSHAVTVVNSGAETIRRIEIGPSGENRLRSQLPPGASGRITYSTGCRADVRLGFDGGRSEAFAGVDVCNDPRVVTGGGAAGAPMPSVSAPARPGGSAAKPAALVSANPVKAPPPIVPPWTGKSITRRFGGME